MQRKIPGISGLRDSAFTLLELMVAMAISLLLAAVVLSLSTKMIGDLTSQNERLQTQAVARFALDRISQDFEVLTPLPPSAQWLNLSAASTNFANIPADELMFFTMARDRPSMDAMDGNLAAVSYRVIVQSLQNDGESFFGLYRAVIGAEKSFMQGSSGTNLTELWNDGGPFFSEGRSRSSLLAQNVVGFRVLLNFQNKDGTLQSESAPLHLGPISSGSSAMGSLVAQRQLVSAEVSLTILRPRGERAREEGVLSNEAILEKYGDTYTRMIPIISAPSRR